MRLVLLLSLLYAVAAKKSRPPVPTVPTPSRPVTPDDLRTAWTPGCFIWDVIYKGKDIEVAGVTKPIVVAGETSHAAHASGVRECQQLCHDLDVGCVTFTYYPNAKTCYLESAGAELVPFRQEMVVSGPATCEEPSPTCTGLPDDSWPGDYYSESMEAWPAGYQPMMAQCWLRFKDAAFMPCLNVTVLEDTATTGWPGMCNMMSQVDVPAPVEASCKQTCFDDVECSSWQVNHLDQCFHGLGENCWSNPTWDALGTKPKAAQRLMHGSYRVLKEWNGVQILGLRQVFNNENALKMESLGQDPADSCMMTCLSKIRCQYWQLDNSSGCWIEDPMDNCWVDDVFAPVECSYNSHSAKVVPYPLLSTDIPEFPNAKKSQFIQRFCPLYRMVDEEAAPTAPPMVIVPGTTINPPPVVNPNHFLPPSGQNGTVPSAHGTFPKPDRVAERYLAAKMSKIPGYTGNTIVEGGFKLTEAAVDHYYMISYQLSGLQPSSTGGWHVHVGGSCDNPGAHLLLEDSTDPWAASKWHADASGVAQGSFSAAVDKQLVGHTLVVHLPDGTKAACGVIHITAPEDEPPSYFRRKPSWLGWILLMIGTGLLVGAGYTLCSSDDGESDDDSPAREMTSRSSVEGSPLLK